MESQRGGRGGESNRTSITVDTSLVESQGGGGEGSIELSQDLDRFKCSCQELF